MFSWRYLKLASDTSIIKKMYFWVFFVPIAVKILSHINSPLKLNVFGATIALELQLPFNWVIFYCASLSFLIALIIYLCSAPKIIKDHDTYHHFLSEGKSMYQLKDYAEQVQYQLSDMNEAVRRAGGENASDESVMQQAFWNIIQKAEQKRVILRWLSSSFYIIGFVLITIVFIQNNIFVITHFNFKNINFHNLNYQ